VTFDPTNLATFEELQRIILRLELDPHAKVLPAHWTPWRQPVPALPIDEFITTLAGRKRKPRVRSPDELGCYRLGECPYAMARAGVAKAINFATLRADFHSFLAAENAQEAEQWMLAGKRPQTEKASARSTHMCFGHISSFAITLDFRTDPECSHLKGVADRWTLSWHHRKLMEF
jgi:hypothetical protein